MARKTLAFLCALGFLGMSAYAAQQQPPQPMAGVTESVCTIKSIPTEQGVLASWYEDSTGVIEGYEVFQKIISNLTVTSADEPTGSLTPEDDYRLVLKAYIKIDQSGSYRFKIDAADSRNSAYFWFKLGGTQYFSFDRSDYNSMATDPIALKAGWYEIEIDATSPQGNDLGFSLTYAQPGSPVFVAIPAQNLQYDTRLYTFGK